MESDWGGFLIDADAVAALPFFERATKAVAHADVDIVREAWDESRTIVTSNGRDFLRHIQEFQNPPNNQSCRDLWGLVVIPNAQLARERGLEAIRLGLDVSQKGRLRWPGAALLNLYVRLTTDGQVEVHRFKRCPFCEHPDRGIVIKEPWNQWYRALPISGNSA